jgi:hypothetical protein
MAAGVSVRREVWPFPELLKRLGYELLAVDGPAVGEPADRRYLVLDFPDDRARQLAAFRIGQAAGGEGLDMRPVGRGWDIERRQMPAVLVGPVRNPALACALAHISYWSARPHRLRLPRC